MSFRGVALAFSLVLAPGLGPGPLAVSAQDARAGSECVDPGQLGGYWPPSGSADAAARKGDPPIQIQLQIPFDRVQVVRIVCGDVRGRGQDDYITFELPPPTPYFRSIVLAALHREEDMLVLLDIEGPDSAYDGLLLVDVTGDGRPEVVFSAGTGAFTAARFAVWTWRGTGYRKLFDGGADYPPGFTDLDGDGIAEMILAERALRFAPRVEGLVWPTAYRWDGLGLRAALFPDRYTGFLIRALRVLDAGEHFSSEEHNLRTQIGHVHEIQGRRVEAREQYERAWAMYGPSASPLPCRTPTEAVQEYYRGIPENLPRAYSMLSQGARDRRSYPEYAAGFSRTRWVRLDDGPRVIDLIDLNGDTFTIAVGLVSGELAPEGEIEQRFQGTWRVRQTAGTCVLESADITRVD